MTRPWRWAGALGAFAVCGVLGWWQLSGLSLDGLQGPPPLVLAGTAGPAAVAPEPAASLPADARDARVGAAARPMPVALPAAPSRRAGVAQAVQAAPAWDICGIGTVPLPPAQAGSSPLDVEPPLHLFPRDGLAAAHERVPTAMDRGAPLARAVAVLLRAADDTASTRDGAIERLNALALDSGDPAVLSLAALRCSGSGCNPAVVDAWVRAEPTNAAAWFSLVQQQPGRHDEALVALAQVQTHRLRWGTMAGAVLDAMPPDVPPVAQLGLVIDATGIDAATGLPPMQPLTALCRAPPPLDDGTQAACTALARAMAEHSDTLLGARIGLRLASLTGWPQQRVDAMRAGLDSLQRNQHAMLDLAQPLSCASVHKQLDWTALVARIGEMGALRERAAAAASASAAARR